MSELKMKGAVLYDTSHGNTQKIAETLRELGVEADLFTAKRTKKSTLFTLCGYQPKIHHLAFFNFINN